MVDEELGKTGWSVQDLAGCPNGDPRELLRMAARLRQETTMALAWIRASQSGACRDA